MGAWATQLLHTAEARAGLRWLGGSGEDAAMMEATAGLQQVGAGRGARRVTFSSIDVVLGAAETDTGARGEQSGALDEAGEGLRAAEGDKVSGQKRTRGKRTAGGKRQAVAKRRATGERRASRLGRATRGEGVWSASLGTAERA